MRSSRIWSGGSGVGNERGSAVWRFGGWKSGARYGGPNHPTGRPLNRPGFERSAGWVVRTAVTRTAFPTAKPADRLTAQDSSRISEAQSVLSALVESYGVSGMEAPVRATVQRLLPSWARTETDS